MSLRIALFFALILATNPSTAGVKVAGAEFVPKDLIFAASESKSRASAEGILPNECTWSFLAQTRIGAKEDSQRCVRFYFKTTVTLVQSCPARNKPAVERLAERITATPNRCPDAKGPVTPPAAETTVISSGTTVDGRHQEIVRQPDGTRITLSYDDKFVAVTTVFPDGTTDVLKLP